MQIRLDDERSTPLSRHAVPATAACLGIVLILVDASGTFPGSGVTMLAGLALTVFGVGALSVNEWRAARARPPEAAPQRGPDDALTLAVLAIVYILSVLAALYFWTLALASPLVDEDRH